MISTLITVLWLRGVLAFDGGTTSDFEQLAAITGEWKSTNSRRPIGISYRPMSAYTVLVETYGVGSGRETLTIFHPDGATLVATHYCAQGNQPRLRIEKASNGRWVFTFADATNLPDAKASHLVRLELELIDPNHLIRVETYRANEKEDVARLDLERVH